MSEDNKVMMPLIEDAAERFVIAVEDSSKPTIRDIAAGYTSVGSILGCRHLTTSNHVVFKHSEFWVKMSRDISGLAVRELEVEAQAYKIIGVSRVFEINDDFGAILVTPHLGEHTLNPLPVDDYVEKLDEYWEDGKEWYFSERIPKYKDLLPIFEKKIKYRLQSVSKEVRDTVEDFFPHGLELLSQPYGLGLTHTDVHFGNWVHDGNKLSLIDWEHALFGPQEVDRAALAHSYAVVANKPEAYDYLRSISDPAVFDMFFRFKSASALAWLAWNQGEDAALKRIKVLNRYIY